MQHIVFRLADALPPGVLRDLDNAPREIRLDAAETTLDAGVGCRALADPRLAQLVEDALFHFDAERYQLFAWCVMPTHVHLLAAQVSGWTLGTVVHGLKSFTANGANRVLKRVGPFWAPEYFDRMMRSPEQQERTIAYIESNPVVAGLCATPESWCWSSANARFQPARSAGFQPASSSLRAGWKPALREEPARGVDRGGVGGYRPTPCLVNPIRSCWSCCTAST